MATSPASSGAAPDAPLPPAPDAPAETPSAAEKGTAAAERALETAAINAGRVIEAGRREGARREGRRARAACSGMPHSGRAGSRGRSARITRLVRAVLAVVVVAALVGRGATGAAEQRGEQCPSGRCRDGEDGADDRAALAAALEGVELLWPHAIYHAQLGDPAVLQVCVCVGGWVGVGVFSAASGARAPDSRSSTTGPRADGH
jgi:hypothetical protein